MKLHHVLFLCFTSALWDGNTISAKRNIYTGAEGGSGTVSCRFTTSGSGKFFCKEECREENILVKTDGISASRGRYSIKYTGGSSGRGSVSVTIRNLTQSDSGWYTCAVGTSLVPKSHSDFEIRISDALGNFSQHGMKHHFVHTNTEGEIVTYACFNAAKRSRIFFCKNKCEKEDDVLIDTNENRAHNGRYSIEYKEGSISGLYVTITQVTKSDTGWYRCGYGSPLSSQSYHLISVVVVDAPGTTKPNLPLRPLSTPVPTTSTPPTTLGSSSSSGSSTGSSVSPESSEQPAAAAQPTSKPLSTPVPPTSTPPTTLGSSSSSGSSTGSSVFPESTEQLADTAQPTSKPLSTPVPPTSTTPTTFGSSSSSGSSTGSLVSPESSEQPAGAAQTTSKPSSTPVPPTSTPAPTQGLSSSLGSSTPSSVSPEVTAQPTAFSYAPWPGYFFPLVACVTPVGVFLLAAFLWLLYKRKTRSKQQT